MKIYIDRSSGTWGAVQDLRVLDASTEQENNLIDHLLNASDSEILEAAKNGLHISTLLAQSYRKGYKDAIDSIASNE